MLLHVTSSKNVSQLYEFCGKPVVNGSLGDMVKYFLYVYSPDSVEDDLNSSQEGDTSVDGEMETSIDEGGY